eukprot:2214534-Rhodomonas_salina.2
MRARVTLESLCGTRELHERTRARERKRRRGLQECNARMRCPSARPMSKACDAISRCNATRARYNVVQCKAKRG